MNHGRIIYHGSPQSVLEELRGQVWQKSIARDELEQHKQMYTVISDKMVAGKPLIHVLGNELPGEGFEAVEPNLEDVFFTKINASEKV
jgi:ABC-type multidrug transport system ATPase subunit